MSHRHENGQHTHCHLKQKAELFSLAQVHPVLVHRAILRRLKSQEALRALSLLSRRYLV